MQSGAEWREIGRELAGGVLQARAGKRAGVWTASTTKLSRPASPVSLTFFNESDDRRGGTGGQGLPGNGLAGLARPLTFFTPPRVVAR